MAFVHYRELEVFKKAYGLALDIHRTSESFPKHELYGGIADQMRRASKGVCANLAEGLGKWSTPAEQRRFLGIALGSVEEIRLWTLFCKDLVYISEAIFSRWDGEYEQVARMLFALMERRGKGASSPSVGRKVAA